MSENFENMIEINDEYDQEPEIVVLEGVDLEFRGVWIDDGYGSYRPTDRLE